MTPVTHDKTRPIPLLGISRDFSGSQTQDPEFLKSLLAQPQYKIDPNVLTLPHWHGNSLCFPKAEIEECNSLRFTIRFECCGLTLHQSTIPHFDDYCRILVIATPNWVSNYWLSGYGLPEKGYLYICPYPTRLTEHQWEEMKGLFSPPFNVRVEEFPDSGYTSTHETFSYSPDKDHAYSVYRHSISPREPGGHGDFITLESNAVWVHSETEYARPGVHFAPPPQAFHLFQGPKSAELGWSGPLSPEKVFVFPEVAGGYSPWYFEDSHNVAVHLYEDLRKKEQAEIARLYPLRPQKGETI